MAKNTQSGLDSEARAWTRGTVDKLKSSIENLGIKHTEPKTRRTTQSRKPAAEEVSGSTAKKYGMVNRIRFRFPRHMVFVHKGVSRGHPASNPREAKEWFNPVIEKEIGTLADIVAENAADMVVNTAFDKLRIR